MELTILSSGTNANTFIIAEARGPKILLEYNLKLCTEMAHFFYTETLLGAEKL